MMCMGSCVATGFRSNGPSKAKIGAAARSFNRSVDPRCVRLRADGAWAPEHAPGCGPSSSCSSCACGESCGGRVRGRARAKVSACGSDVSASHARGARRTREGRDEGMVVQTACPLALHAPPVSPPIDVRSRPLTQATRDSSFAHSFLSALPLSPPHSSQLLPFPLSLLSLSPSLSPPSFFLTGVGRARRPLLRPSDRSRYPSLPGADPRSRTHLHARHPWRPPDAPRARGGCGDGASRHPAA